ncbi:GDP-mannose 4,6-dehydratase [Erythrobacter sp. F6033]|uniref:GDP-mannose 4,6-dehydratase n=1 Tax=Erythrobacter sp. F6033 TaxID=2926401 RepID=UPI001FF67051|nr:GDP-mannose 4,6-dehydratase [Erythrobacter sp. F6033]MCK0129799.1 GDP-mannose 4,6-dehydratase [Erythrobacter sp. F6033]
MSRSSSVSIMSKRALICGISGQDGAYLAKLLVENGYEVFGTSRDAERSEFSNLAKLGVKDQVTLRSMSLADFRSVLSTVAAVEPDEIYNLAGQSSVGLSFEQPVETMESISLGVLNLLEVIRFTGGRARLYNAGSSECFGDTGEVPANEETPFRPRSPYAVAKSAAHWAVANYREAYGIYACNGILFNHESPLRPARFVTSKIIQSAVAIKQGRLEKLSLGNIDIARDWGSAREYVEAMWKMLQQDQPDDFVIATGQTSTLAEFLAAAFDAVELDWQDYVEFNKAFARPSDIRFSGADPSKAARVLGWSAQSKMRDVVNEMVAAEFERHSNQ